MDENELEAAAPVEDEAPTEEVETEVEETESSATKAKLAADEPAPKKRMGGREKAFLAVAIVAVVAAIAGFALFFVNQVPASAAAKVNDMYIEEADVADYIAQYRSSYSLTDDATWASYLLSNNSNPTSYRMTAINQLALNALVIAKAEELGVSPSEEDVDESMESLKESLALNDEDLWNDTLEQMGTTEEYLREQALANLATQAVYKAAVEVPEATDEQCLSYAQTNMAGVELAHSYRIVFTGDDAEARATECATALKAAGKMTVAKFSEFAAEYSDEEGASEDGGSYDWTQIVNSEDLDLDYASYVTELKNGEFSDPKAITDDDTDTMQIIFRDASYTFPSESKIDDLTIDDLPEGLLDYVGSYASNSLWQSNCSAYLSALLANAQITYYPTPADAAYNVDMNLATTSSSTSGTASSE